MIIKPSILEGIASYVARGIPPGGFLRAVLENDLMEAAARADDENLAALGQIARYVYFNVPERMYGNREKVAAWIKATEPR